MHQFDYFKDLTIKSSHTNFNLKSIAMTVFLEMRNDIMMLI